MKISDRFKITKRLIFMLVSMPTILFAQDQNSIDQYDSLLNQTIQDKNVKSKLDLITIKKSKFSATVGLISLDLVYLFHPKMKNYNYLMNSFFTPIPTNLSIPIQYYLKNKLTAYKKFKKNFIQKELEMQRKLTSVSRELDQLKEDFLDNDSDDLSTQDFRSKEQNYWSKRHQLEAQRKKLVSDFQVWQSNNNKDFLMSDQQRDIESKKIVQEVQEVIESLVEKEELNFVFNVDSDLYGRSKTSFQLPSKTMFWQEYNDYSMLLKDELFFNYKKRGETYQYYAALSAHLSYYPKIKNTFSQNFQSSPFVGKSKNITLTVLKILFDKYKYSNKMKSQLLGLIQKTLKRGK